VGQKLWTSIGHFLDMSDAGDGHQVRRKRTFTVMREKIEIAKYDSKVAASIRRRVDLNGLLAAADKVKDLDRALAKDILSCIAPVRVFLLWPNLLFTFCCRTRRRSSFLRS